MASRSHVFCRFPSDQEASVASQFPGLEEQPLRGLDQWLIDVGPGVEQADLDRANFCFDFGEQCLHLRLVAGVDAKS